MDLKTEKIYDSQVVTAYYNEEKQLFINEWKEATATMSFEEFKQQACVDFLKVHEQYNPSKVLVDARKYAMVLTDEQQSYVDNTLMKGVIDAGAKKMATLLPEEIFTSLSVEQLIETGHIIDDCESKYFGSKDEAISWILEE